MSRPRALRLAGGQSGVRPGLSLGLAPRGGTSEPEAEPELLALREPQVGCGLLSSRGRFERRFHPSPQWDPGQVTSLPWTHCPPAAPGHLPPLGCLLPWECPDKAVHIGPQEPQSRGRQPAAHAPHAACEPWFAALLSDEFADHWVTVGRAHTTRLACVCGQFLKLDNGDMEGSSYHCNCTTARIYYCAIEISHIKCLKLKMYSFNNQLSLSDSQSYIS